MVRDVNLIESPLFIIGSPRSGTSLLRLVMTSHSQVLIPPECGFIVWLYNKYKDWNISHNTDSDIVSQFVIDLFASKKFDTWLLVEEDIKCQIIVQKPSSFSNLCALVYGCFGLKIKKNFSIWGDKNNFYLNHIPELVTLYEEARFLHIVRDGRDVACSYREVMAAKSSSPYAPKLDTNITVIAQEWSQNVLRVDESLSKLLPSKVMTIRYEDLVRTPIVTIKSICSWLGVGFEVDMLNFHQHNLKNKLEPELTLDWKKRTLQPISRETVGRYSDLLSVDDQAEFLSTAKLALQKFAYV